MLVSEQTPKVAQHQKGNLLIGNWNDCLIGSLSEPINWGSAQQVQRQLASLTTKQVSWGGFCRLLLLATFLLVARNFAIDFSLGHNSIGPLTFTHYFYLYYKHYEHFKATNWRRKWLLIKWVKQEEGGEKEENKFNLVQSFTRTKLNCAI